ncbi:hypothetical protein HMPREF9406_3694 [Clostridium sp. HGF2]|nr:hypothetical protein HMPREF9406_3694 [Clostridium sp. HGF2]
MQSSLTILKQFFLHGIGYILYLMRYAIESALCLSYSQEYKAAV